MDFLSRQPPPSSALNPDAPIFIPMAAYRTVEDFSQQWWDLVRSSPSFRDYWLQDCFVDSQFDPFFFDDDDLFLPDFDSLFDDYLRKEEEEKSKERDLIRIGSLKWNDQKHRGTMEGCRYREKALKKKMVNVKVNPRTIHQPR